MNPEVGSTVTFLVYNSFVTHLFQNFASRAVLEALGSCLNNKYSEGYPGQRYVSTLCLAEPVIGMYQYIVNVGTTLKGTKHI